ncbi:unnamed protein product [Ilex paraguariensis]|uniref:X8 domain-containing protein n=1 Tax=Ilex paraguariensis TaxID=185542 RepID=A0ABC8SMD8_9AQUA
MARGASKCLFLFFLFILIACSSGTLVGFFYDARKSNEILSPTETISFLKLNKVTPSQIKVLVADHRVLDSLSNTSVFVDLYLNKTQAENLRNYKPSAISWLKTLSTTYLPHVHTKSVVVSSRRNDLPGELLVLLSTLKSIHSMLGSFRLDTEVKPSVALPLSFLENLNGKHEGDLHRIFDFINKTRSFITVEASIDGELSMGDRFVELVIKRATLAASVFPDDVVSMVLAIKSSAVPSAVEVAEFGDKILKSLKNSPQIKGKISGLFVEVSPIKEFEQKELKREEEQIFHSSHRELLDKFNYRITQHDSINPPTTIFPTTPITNPVTTPVTVPPDSSAPTVVTIPSTNPVTVTPNPASTPLTVPSTNPVPVPYTSPIDSPVPITNPVTTPSTNPGAQPVTNPVTTYPPSGGVPVTTPVTVPVTPPVTANSPAVPGQSWCVVKSGTLETALQSALDYACGIGGADCSTIQQSGSCYNPNTLQNHASYAFNSYFQKNPTQSSCDFGGTAMITNVNPMYPSTPASGTTLGFGDGPPSVNASTSTSSGDTDSEYVKTVFPCTSTDQKPLAFAHSQGFG